MFSRLLTLWRRSRDIGSNAYERLSILQRTNMSEVWLAERKRDRAITVAKIARVDNAHYAKANQRAIRNEAYWLGRFTGYRRVVQLEHTAKTNLEGEPHFIAVEYLAGGTLEDLLNQLTMLGRVNATLLRLAGWVGIKPKVQSRQPNALRMVGVRAHHLVRGALPVEQALHLFQQIAEGLARVHQEGLVHRDIKPDNLMFRKQPVYGRSSGPDDLVLIDFGVTAPKDRLSGVAVARGWSEPRLIKAREAGEKLVVKTGFDIYCLGKVLRFMVTGEKPTSQRSEADLRAVIPPELLRMATRLSAERRLQLANEITTLVRRCLADNPDDRPSAAQLVADAELLLTKLRPLPSPNRRPGLAVTVAILLVAAMLVWSLGWFNQGGPAQTNLLAWASAWGIWPVATPPPGMAATASPTQAVTPPPTVAATFAATSTVSPTSVTTTTPVTHTVTPAAPATATRPAPTPTRAPTATPTTTTALVLPPAIACPDPRAVITYPRPNQVVKGTIEIRGTAKHERFKEYKIEFARGSGSDLVWGHLSTSAAQVNNGVLGVWDTTPYADDIWSLRIVVKDVNDVYPPPCEVQVTLDNVAD
jgi:serine/threonine protein kinase